MEVEGHKDVDREALSRLTGAPRRTWVSQLDIVMLTSLPSTVETGGGRIVIALKTLLHSLNEKNHHKVNEIQFNPLFPR